MLLSVGVVGAVGSRTLCPLDIQGISSVHFLLTSAKTWYGGRGGSVGAIEPHRGKIASHAVRWREAPRWLDRGLGTAQQSQVWCQAQPQGKGPRQAIPSRRDFAKMTLFVTGIPRN